MKNKTAVLGLFAALAILLGYVESLIPFFFFCRSVRRKDRAVNLMIVFLLYLYGWRGGPDFCHTDSGDQFSVWQSVQYSVQSCGRIFKPACDGTAQRAPGFTVIGVSVAGGVAHNTAQIAVAVCLVSTFKLMYYLPVLLVSGVVTGAGIGIVSRR